MQIGILYGRRFPLKDKHFEMDAEFGASKNIWSNNRLTSDNRDLSDMDGEVDRKLDYYYSRYGYIPTLTVAFVYKIPVETHFAGDDILLETQHFASLQPLI